MKQEVTVSDDGDIKVTQIECGVNSKRGELEGVCIESSKILELAIGRYHDCRLSYGRSPKLDDEDC